MADEVYLETDAIAVTSIPIIKADNSIAVGVTSIPTNLGISTQAITVTDRIVSGVLVGNIYAPKIKISKVVRYRKGRKVIKYTARNKRVE